MSTLWPQVFLPAGRDALATFAFQHVTAARDNGYWRCPPSKLERRSPRSHCAREPVEPLPFVDLSLRLVAAGGVLHLVGDDRHRFAAVQACISADANAVRNV